MGQKGIVSAAILYPVTFEWTQDIGPANTYDLSIPLTFTQLVVKSDGLVHIFGDIFDAIYTGGIPDEDFQDIIATIRIFGNNEEVQSFQFEEQPLRETSEQVNGTVSL